MDQATKHDLRIGNRIRLYCNQSDFEEIDIDINDINCIHRYDHDYEPIPLTEEQMKKFGLTNENNFTFLEGKFQLCTYTVEKDVYCVVLAEENIMIKEGLRYVHEYQNFYREISGNFPDFIEDKKQEK